jgi:eukaryotic-like serine/threonine-protein kinase
MIRMGGVAIVLFSDLVDSTQLLARLGDDRMDQVRRAHVRDVSDAVEEAGGRVVKTLGDGAMASFESALGALHAGAAIQAGVGRLDAAQGDIGIAARIGVAAGEPIPDGDDLHGMAVVIASRLSSAAASGEVLVQDLVQALVASRDGVTLGEPRDYELKGVPAPVRASKLRWRELTTARPKEGSVEAGPAGPPAAGEGIRLPPALAAYAEEPLIGREREIAALREATAPGARRRAVLVLGEPGIGKTRHAAAAAAEAHARGAAVVLARCQPETVTAFEPWVRAIGELALAGDDAWRASLAEAAGAELAVLVPELSEHAAPSERSVAADVVLAEGARYRVLRGIVATLARAAGGAPLHVLLDDAHWCDPASAQALGHLLDSAPAELVLVVTARDREMGRGHPVSRVLADLRRTADLQELRLEGLDTSGLAALVGARLGRAITPGVAERLQARSSGNPFFAGELARDLEERGGLQEGDAVETAPAPEAISELVEERLLRLDPDAERLLVAVAAIGPSAPVALAAKAAGLDLDRSAQAVREALSERLVDDVPAAQPTVAFPHALIREALIAGTGEAERARLHLAIAEALDDEVDAEPAELARHRGLAMRLTGPEPAIAAYRAAASASAEGHDHEQAAVHLRSVLTLLPESDERARAQAWLELGEQELLAADLMRARGSFRAACEAARATGDATTLARAALGFAGGDVGFGWEAGTDDPASAALLREGLEALGEDEPRLALRMVFRLAYLLVFSDEREFIAALGRRAAELEPRLDDVEAQILARFTAVVGVFVHCDDPLRVFDTLEEEMLALLELAADCAREDLVFRIVQWSVVVHYGAARIPECEEAIERAAEIAKRLGSPRFSWEIDLNRGMRLLDRGDRAAAEALIHRAGAVVRRLRPDIQMIAEVGILGTVEAIYDNDQATTTVIWEAMQAALPRGVVSASLAFNAAVGGELGKARERMWAMLGDDLEPLRHPDGQVPAAVCWLAFTASLVGDAEAGARLRPLLEPLRTHLGVPAPMIGLGFTPEWHIGQMELLAGRRETAIAELRGAVESTDDRGIVWSSALVRVDLARALNRAGDPAAARAVLAEAESIAERYGVGWAAYQAGRVRAELDGLAPPTLEPAMERPRPIRALATRGSRRALATLVRGLDDAELERRFAEPRRQRTVLKAIARGFQPDRAAGFQGTIAYELEPFAIEPPPDAPWRWAIEVNAKTGRARVREPAPLDAAATVHIALADWVRIVAGTEDPLATMVAGRCSVEGDVLVAVRLQAMFGAQ